MDECTVIIPALLRHDEDDILLRRTAEKIPRRERDRLILVTQGNRPSDWVRTVHPHLIWRHFDVPIGKWGAIDVARQEISPTTSKVVLLDADDVVIQTSLEDVWRRMEDCESDLLIGDRRQIALHSADELSPNTRLYVEIFSNALLLLRLGEVFSEGKAYPDIQSGFYVVDRTSFERVRFDYLGAYGGELALYCQLAEANCRIAQTPIETRPTEASSYGVKRIVDDIFALPFFSDVRIDELETAKASAPLMYARYLDSSERSAYFKEIDHILAMRPKP
jgi:hypothetical protein